MGGSGLIYAGLVLVWAAFLVPMWLRRVERRDPSAEGLPLRARVLRRRPGRTRADAETSDGATPVGRARRAGATIARVTSRVASRHPGRGPRGASARPPSRAPRPARPARPVLGAAARRRRILLILLALVALVGAAAAARLVPVVAVAAPGALLLAYLVLLVATGRRRAAARTLPRPRRPRELPAARAAAPRALEAAPVVEAVPVEAVQVEGPEPASAPVPEPERLPAPVGATVAARPRIPSRPPASAPHPCGPAGEVEPVLLAGPGAHVQVQVDVPGPQAYHPRTDPTYDPREWQPVPVPLPTYVTAPKATRTIRTIDLRAPGPWATPATPPVVAPMPEPSAPVQQPRAVGD